MKKRAAVTLTIILAIVLSACGESAEPKEKQTIPVLDRQKIIDFMPKDTSAAVESSTREEVCVLLDNSFSMSGFLSVSNTTLYSEALQLCGASFSEHSAFKGYRMLDVLAAPNDAWYNESGSDFFERASQLSSYEETKPSYYNSKMINQSDEGRIGEALDAFVKETGSESNKLCVLITDLSAVTDSKPSIDSVAAALSPFVRSETANVGIIAVQSMYYGGLPNAPYLSTDESTKELINLSKYIGSYDINGGYGAERPVYFIFMGSNELVERYMSEILRALPYNEDKIKSLTLDEFPVSKEPPPMAVPLTPVPPDVKLGGQFANYAMELPENKEALSYVFASPLSGKSNASYSGEQLDWDKYITDGSIPFWRIWDEGISDSWAEFSLTFKVDKDVTVDPDEIKLRYFTANSNGVVVTEIDNSNKYINIGSVEQNKNTLTIQLRLLQAKLSLNEPILFLLDAPLEKTIPAASYEPVDYSGGTVPAWFRDWTLDLDAYWYNVHRYIPPEYDAGGNVIRSGFWNYWPGGGGYGSGYEHLGKTFQLSGFIENLYRSRQSYIREMNVPKVNTEVHQYALFGFVVRQTYSKELTAAGVKGNPAPLEDGGYAFSLDEAGKMRALLKAAENK